MKILCLHRWDTRNPTDGQLLYSDGLISSLERLGANITVLATSRPDTNHLPPVFGRKIQEPSRWPKPLSLFSTLSSDAFMQRSRGFMQALRTALKELPDVVIFEYYATGWALDLVIDHYRANRAPRPLIVYISHNHEASLRRKVAAAYQGNAVMRLVVRMDAAKAARLENRLMAHSDLVFAITDDDAELYRQEFPDKDYVTLLPAYGGAFREAGFIRGDTPKRVIMMGSMLWIAKKENIRRFIAAAGEKFTAAGIELLLIGRSEPEFLEAMRKLSPCVNAVGFVEDPLPLLHTSRIGLMPDELGGGFKLRVMDYIFNGVPLAVIRSQIKGLPINPATDMIAAEDVEDLADQIISTIDNIDALNEMAKRAQAKCVNKFDWDSRGMLVLETINAAQTARKRLRPGDGLE